MSNIGIGYPCKGNYRVGIIIEFIVINTIIITILSIYSFYLRTTLPIKDTIMYRYMILKIRCVMGKYHPCRVVIKSATINVNIIKVSE